MEGIQGEGENVVAMNELFVVVHQHAVGAATT